MLKSQKGIKGFQKTDKKTHKSKKIAFFLDEREYIELMLYLSDKKESKSKILRDLVMNVVRSQNNTLDLNTVKEQRDVK